MEASLETFRSELMEKVSNMALLVGTGINRKIANADRMGQETVLNTHGLDFQDYLERHFYSDEGARRFLQRCLSNETSTACHALIASLVKAGFFRLILTTNYDSYLEECFAERNISAFVTVSDRRPGKQLRNDDAEVEIIKLHGSVDNSNFHRKWGRANALESRIVRRVEQRFRDSRNRPISPNEFDALAVVGYRGADAGVIDLLKNLLRKQKLPCGLVWFGLEGVNFHPNVRAIEELHPKKFFTVRIRSAEDLFSYLLNPVTESYRVMTPLVERLGERIGEGMQCTVDHVEVIRREVESRQEAFGDIPTTIPLGENRGKPAVIERNPSIEAEDTVDAFSFKRVQAIGESIESHSFPRQSLGFRSRIWKWLQRLFHRINGVHT